LWFSFFEVGGKEEHNPATPTATQPTRNTTYENVNLVEHVTLSADPSQLIRPISNFTQHE
jgi:hypothetical protein